MNFRLIDHRLMLPDEPAWFDPATLFIGTQFQRSVVHSGDLDWQHPVAAVSHELAHFYQAISTPYLLEWGMRWRHFAMRVVPDDPHELAAGLRGYLRSYLNDASAQSLISGARELALKRVAPGAFGLSLNDLLESHAFFLEARLYGSNADSSRDFLRFLDDQCPAPQYRRAFDLFRLWCGDETAYKVFHAAVVGALCSSRPIDRFEQLMVDCSRLEPTETDRFLRAMALNWDEALAWMSVTKSGDQELQAYTNHFLSWSSKLNLMELIASPRSLLSFPHHPAVLYAGDDAGQFDLLPGTVLPEGLIGLDEADQEAALVFEYTIAAISQWLLCECTRGDGTSPLSGAEFSWMEQVGSGELELPIVVDNWGAGRGGDFGLVGKAVLRDVDRVVSIVAELNGGNIESICIPALRRIKLTFVTESDLEVWQIAEVQDFIRHLSRQLPWFPLLLRFTNPGTLFLVWFGSLAPTGVSGASIDLGQSAVRTEILRFLTSVDSALAGLAVNLTPCLRAALGPLLR